MKHEKTESNRLLTGIIDQFTKNQYEHFFLNFDKIFEKVHFSNLGDFTEEGQVMPGSDSVMIREAIFKYFEYYVIQEPMLNNKKCEKTGEIKYAFVHYSVVLSLYREDYDYYTSYLISKIVKQAHLYKVFDKRDFILTQLILNWTWKE